VMAEAADEIERLSALTEAAEASEPKSDWFAGDVDSDGNELVTVRADELKVLREGPPYASDSWDVHGYSSPAEEIDDMANVGRSLMDRIASVVVASGPFKGWHPADCPSEIVTDMANYIAEASELEICPDCTGAGGDNNTYVCPRCNGTGGVQAEAKRPVAVILKGTGKISGDGWKDTTRKGEVVFVWNAELPSPYSAGQYPRVGNEIWSASTEQYDFEPATVDEVRTLYTRPANEAERIAKLEEALRHTADALERELGDRADPSLDEEELIAWLGKDYGRMTIGHLIRLRQARDLLKDKSDAQ